MRRRANGFGTLVPKGPGRPWLARWSYRGKIYTRSTGERDKAKAEKALERLTRPFREETEAEVLRALESRARAAEDRVERPKTPLGSLADAYMALPCARDLAEGSRALYAGYAGSAAGWLSAERGRKFAEDVTADDARAYLAWLAERTGAQAYNLRLSFLRKAWRELGAGSPWDGQGKRKPGAGSRRALSPGELRRLLEEASRDPDDLLMVALGTYTGLRLGDCALLKWEDLDPRGLARVVPMKTKRHMPEPVEIPLHPAVRAVLEARPGPREGYVSARNAEGWSSGHLSRRMSALFARAGLETSREEGGLLRITSGFHSLRHTFVSLAVGGGMSPLLVQKVVGHSCVEMTSRYFHGSAEAVRAGVMALPDLSSGKAAREPGALTEAGVAALRAAFRESDGDLDGTARRLAKLAEAV